MKKRYSQFLWISISALLVCQFSFMQISFSQEMVAQPTLSDASQAQMTEHYQTKVDVTASVSIKNSTEPVNPLDKRVHGSVTGRNVEIQTFLNMLQGESGLQFVLDGGISEKVSCSLENPTIREVLTQTLPTVGLTYVICDNGIVRIGREDSIGMSAPRRVDKQRQEKAQEIMKQRIDGPVIARDQDLQTILNLLIDKTKALFYLDKGIQKNVSFSLDSPTVGSLLDTVLPANGLAYQITDEGNVRIGLKDIISMTQEERFQKIRKSLAVMSSILDFMLKDRLGEGYQPRGLFSKGTQGYWIPGSGLMFILGVKFPLIAPENKDREDVDEEQKDLWEQFEDKIGSPDDGNARKKVVQKKTKTIVPSVTIQMNNRDMQFDADKLETLRNTVLEALAKYGCRFEGYEDNETITVVVEGEGSGSFVGNVFGNSDSRQRDVLRRFADVRERYQIKNPKERKTVSLTPTQNARRNPGSAFPEVVEPEITKPELEKPEAFDDIVIGTSDQKSLPDLAVVVESAPKTQDSALPISESVPSANQVPVQEGNDSATTISPGNHVSDEQIARVKNELSTTERVLDTRKQDFDASKRELEIVQEQLNAMKKKFETGLIPDQEVLEAEKQVIASQKTVNETQRQLLDEQKNLEMLKNELQSLQNQKNAFERFKRYSGAVDAFQWDNSGLNSIEPFVWEPGLLNEMEPSPQILVIQIRFGDIPKQEGKVEDIRDKVRMTTYLLIPTPSAY